jgi:hypothetical protein
MFNGHHFKRIEELLEQILKLLKRKFNVAISAKGVLMPATIKVGGKGAIFLFTEFDGPNGTGSIVPDSGPISFASDNLAVATVDANGLVIAVSPGVANITGVDPASPNKVAAGDVLTVEAPVQVAVSATGTLKAN